MIQIKKLEYYLNKIEGITQSKGIQTKRANFREEEIFFYQHYHLWKIKK